MTDEDNDQEEGAEQLPWWAAPTMVGLGAAAYLVAKWAKSGELTTAKATKIIQDFDPLHSSPEDRQQMAKAMAFFAREQRKRYGWPINADTDALDKMEAGLNWNMTSEGRMDAVKEFTEHIAKIMKAMPPPVASSGPSMSLCPLCRGRTQIEMRNFYNDVVLVPCVRCGGVGRVPIGG